MKADEYSGNSLLRKHCIQGHNHSEQHTRKQSEICQTFPWTAQSFQWIPPDKGNAFRGMTVRFQYGNSYHYPHTDDKEVESCHHGWYAPTRVLLEPVKEEYRKSQNKSAPEGYDCCCGGGAFPEHSGNENGAYGWSEITYHCHYSLENAFEVADRWRPQYGCNHGNDSNDSTDSY